MTSELQEKEAINRLQRSEIRYHYVKLAVIVVAAIFTAIAVIYYVRKDNDRTRYQINCVVDGFLQPNPQDVPKAVNACKE